MFTELETLLETRRDSGELLKDLIDKVTIEL